MLCCLAWAQLTLGVAHAAEPAVTVEVTGLRDALLRNVQAALVLPPGIVRNDTVEERWLERFAAKIPQRVAEALAPFGRYRSRAEVTIDRLGENAYLIKVQVDPGPQTVITALTVTLVGEGHGEEELRRLVREFPLRRGAALDHQLYEKGKLALRVGARELGYLQADFSTHVIRVEPERDAAEIELVLDTGRRFYFGDTLFEDESNRFDKGFLRRFLTYQRGDVFSHKELHRTRLGFFGAERFDDVLIIPMIDEAADQRVPVRVRLVPGKQQRLRPGIGYGTNTGARLSLNYQNMQVRETPHAFLLDLSLAEKAQFLEARYTIPQPGGADNNLVGTFGLRQEDLDSYRTRMIYVEGEETYGLGRGRTGSLAIRYLREDSDVGSEANVAQMLIPTVRYYQRSYDDPLNPRRGYQFRLEGRGSLDTLLSDVTLGQVLAAGSFMQPVSDRLTLHTRVEGATTVKADELSQVPPSLRFFVGGDNSVRGYNYKSRGPRDESGNVVGGDSLLVGSIEAEYAISDQWGVALFYDAGSAFNATHEFEIIEGAGIGVRRYTQVGPIKIDLARRIHDEDRGFHIHLSVGFDI